MFFYFINIILQYKFQTLYLYCFSYLLKELYYNISHITNKLSKILDALRLSLCILFFIDIQYCTVHICTYTVSPLHDTNLPISLSLYILYICTRTCMQETSQSTYCLVLFIRYFIYGTFGYAVAHKRSSGSFGDAVAHKRSSGSF